MLHTLLHTLLHTPVTYPFYIPLLHTPVAPRFWTLGAASLRHFVRCPAVRRATAPTPLHTSLLAPCYIPLLHTLVATDPLHTCYIPPRRGELKGGFRGQTHIAFMDRVNTIVCGGGGTYGIAYIGAFRELQSKLKLHKIIHLCGTSAGSVVVFA